MQNKANLLDTQMNINPLKTKYYENERLCIRGEKQTQSNPILPATLSGGFIRLRRSQRQRVNFADIALLAEHWLQSGCASPDWCDGTDITLDNKVNGDDLLAIIHCWLWSEP